MTVKSLAAGMIDKAIDDMRSTRPSPTEGTAEETHRRKARHWKEHRVSALCWLASRAAMVWFDGVGIDQRACLERTGWVQHAKDALADHRAGRIQLDLEVRQHLRSTIIAMEG